MPTYSTNKGYPLPTTGGDNNQWGTLLDQGFGIVDSNLGGVASVSVGGNASVTATSVQAQNLVQRLTGALTGNINYILPPVGGLYIIDNETTNNFAITVVTSAQGSSGITVPQGAAMTVYSDGTNVYPASSTRAGSIIASSMVLTGNLNTDGSVGVGTTLSVGFGATISGAGGWSNANFGKQLTITTPTGFSNPALGITDSNGANIWAIGNAAGALDFALMPALADSTSTPNIMLTLKSSGAALAGNTTVSGGIVAAGFDTANGAQFRAIGGTYGAMFRNDGANAYLVQTAANDALGGFNGFRPFQWNLGTGAVTIDGTGAGVTLGGSLSAQGIVAVGAVKGAGFGTRAGSSGAPDTSLFNIHWPSAGGFAYLYIDAANIGYINTTTSDHRFKEAVVDAPAGALAAVRALRPVTFRWNAASHRADTGPVIGLIAHEVAAHIPSAVLGEKDATGAHGGIMPQGLDPLPLIATLVQAVQELSARVAALEPH